MTMPNRLLLQLIFLLVWGFVFDVVKAQSANNEDNSIWNIDDPPQVSYSGMQLNLDYIVGNHVEVDYVSIDLFEDDDCTKLIRPDENDYIAIDLVNDLSPIGDGSSGTRTMYVNLNIDPSTVSQSPVITFNSVSINGQSQAAVSFCIRFNLWDPNDEFNPVPANYNDYVVAVSVDVTQNIGITGLIADEEERYGAIAYECTKSNLPVLPQNITTKNQGDRIRICIEPDEFAQQYVAAMKSINSLSLVRGDVIQEVLVPQGVIKDFFNTQYVCIPGQKVCTVDCLISNDFYYSTGTVYVQGEAILQYAFDLGATVNNDEGGRGRKRKTQLLRRLGQEKQQQQQQQDITVKVESSSSAVVAVQNQKQNHQADDDLLDDDLDRPRSRELREPGGTIGGRPFEFNFQIEPSGAVYKAIAYECNGKNEPLDDNEKSRLRNPGEQIRVCITPDSEAIERGVYIRAIASFFFEQNDIIQFAVEPTAKQASDGNSLVICYPGQPLCAFKMKISENFFNSWDPIVGTGEIYLQFGTELRPLVNRKLISDGDGRVGRVGRDGAIIESREMQITDAGFAGAAEVMVQFKVDPTYVEPTEKTWQEKVHDWWVNTPLFLRIVYIIVLIIVVGILFCILYGLFCGWDTIRRGGRREENEKEPQVVVQPIYMPDGSGDNTEERDFCDCLTNPDYYEYDPNDGPQQQGQQYETSRSAPNFPVPGSVYCDDDSTLPSQYPDEMMEETPPPPPPPPSSAARLTNDEYTDSPASSRRSVGGDSTRTPRRSKKKSSTSKSPKPASRKGSYVDDDGIRVSNDTPKSTRSKVVYQDEADGSSLGGPSSHSGKSPKTPGGKKKKKKKSSEDVERTPRTGGKRSTGDGSVTPKSAKKKSTKSGKTPKKTPKSSKTPKSAKKKKSETNENVPSSDPGIDPLPF